MHHLEIEWVHAAGDVAREYVVTTHGGAEAVDCRAKFCVVWPRGAFLDNFIPILQRHSNGDIVQARTNGTLDALHGEVADSDQLGKDQIIGAILVS